MKRSLIVWSLFTLLAASCTTDPLAGVSIMDRALYRLDSTPSQDKVPEIWMAFQQVPSKFFNSMRMSMKATLPRHDYGQAAVYLNAYYRDVQAAIDGTPFYTAASNSITEHLMPLPDGSSGKTLIISFSVSDMADFNCLDLMVVPLAGGTGKWDAFYREITDRSIGNIAFGLGFILIGAASLFVFLFRASRREFALLFFSLFNLVIGAKFIIVSGTVIQNTGNSVILYNINELLFFAIPVFFTLFIRLTFCGPFWKKVLNFYWIMNLALAPPIFALFVMRKLLFIHNIFTIALATEFLACMAAFFSTVIRMKKDRNFYLLLTSNIALVVFFGLSFAGMEVKYVILATLYFFAILFFITLDNITSRDRELITIQEELSVARKIQRSILPGKKPELGRIRFASLYRPMTAVAGDFYDFMVAGRDKALFLVADVSGHGVPAALIASMMKISFHSRRADLEDPSRLLSSVNDTLYGNIENQFITAGCLFLDTGAMKMNYASAAHPPLLRLDRASGLVETVKPRGTVIGSFPGLTYASHEAPLAHRQRFILYTDGVTETENAAGEEFGERGFGEALSTSRDRPPEDALGDVMKRLEAWNGGKEFQDDITLLVIDVE